MFIDKEVQSESDPNVVYRVYYSWRKGWFCECMDHTMRVSRRQSPECKHIRKVKSELPKISIIE